jgi:ammonium transporter, Amt family
MILEWHNTFDAGSAAWILVATAAVLVLFGPGLWLFYSGLAARRNLAELARTWLVLLAALSVTWSMWIYSLAFGPSWGTVPSVETAEPVVTDLRDMLGVSGRTPYAADAIAEMGRGGVVGGTDYMALGGLTPRITGTGSMYTSRRPVHHLPHTLFMVFQMGLFVAAAAPLAVALSPRVSRTVLVAFAVVWGTLVYAPLAHWIWGEGWLGERGALDFAGGLFHIGIGFSALACAIVLGRGGRTADPASSAAAVPELPEATPASDATLANIGGALTWGGAVLLYSAFTWKADGRAAATLLNTQLAAAAALLTWIATERFVWHRNNPLGACAGAVAGLCAIAPASGLVLPQSAMIVGVVAGVVGCMALHGVRGPMAGNAAWGVFAVQGVAGALGMLLVGVFATSSAAGLTREGRAIEGLVGGNSGQLALQAIALAAAAAWAFLVTAVLAFGLRLAPARAPTERPPATDVT